MIIIIIVFVVVVMESPREMQCDRPLYAESEIHICTEGKCPI